MITREQMAAGGFITRRSIAEALLSQLPQSVRLAVGRALLTSTTDPALFADLSAAAQDVETAAVRLSRTGFERECQ